jgi:hypothetical protein
MIALMSLLGALALAGIAATVVDWSRDGYRRMRPRT